MFVVRQTCRNNSPEVVTPRGLAQQYHDSSPSLHGFASPPHPQGSSQVSLASSSISTPRRSRQASPRPLSRATNTIIGSAPKTTTQNRQHFSTYSYNPVIGAKPIGMGSMGPPTRPYRKRQLDAALVATPANAIGAPSRPLYDVQQPPRRKNKH